MLLRREVEDFKRIRETCIKALMHATGCTREEVEAKPFECAFAAQRKREEAEKLRSDMDSRMQAYCETQEKDEAEIKQLRAQFDDMVRQRDEANMLVYEAGRRHGELLKQNEELRYANADTIMTMDRMRREGALIVYALDRALQLTDLFMSCWPVNMPMHPDVAAARGALDDAWAKVRARGGAT